MAICGLSIIYLFASLLAFICLLPTEASATALTIKMVANEHACFYAWSDTPGKKVGFYFAVSTIGGSFDIDYLVTDPRDRIVLDGKGERQGDYVFTANHPGEYAFCFSNVMSTFAEKLLDFEVTMEDEVRPNFAKASEGLAQPPETLSAMEESLFRLSGSLTNIARTQKYFRTRENRNSSTVASTEDRIFWFASLESIAIIAMAALQVFVVRNFFNVKKGGV
ncbi:unnamed protein product [Absidia cylindrospora]